jgi:hypothetical protein
MSLMGHFLPPSMKLGGNRTCSDSGRQGARSPLASARVNVSISIAWVSMTQSNHSHPEPASTLHAKNDVHDSLHFAEPLRAKPLRSVTSHVDLLSNCQGVIDLDAEVAHRTLDFRMAQ